MIPKADLLKMFSRRTDSTIWPESMRGQSPAHVNFRNQEQPSTGRPALNSSAEIAQATIELLNELDASLHASQKALLARDLSGLERRTTEQASMRRALEILRSRSLAPSDLRLARELHAAGQRVSHTARVQAALLARAQNWLRVIENLLAGPEAIYAPCTSSRLTSTVGEGERGIPCRV